MSSAHLIINRRARRLEHETSPLLATLNRAAERSRIAAHETFNVRELDAVARKIVASAPRAVILAGGDGAYTAGVTALTHACAAEGIAIPPVAFAPGGTVSTTARNWGMRGDLATYATRLLAAVAEDRARRSERPSLRVKDDDAERIGFIWGAGLVARFFHAYDAHPRAGYGAAAAIVARVFVGSPFGGKLARRVLTPVPCEVWIDGSLQSAPAYSLMVASVVRDLGLHMRVLYRAGEDPERLHFVASPLGAPLLGPQMPLVLLGKRLRGRGHVDALTREARVRFAARDDYVLDGDLHTTREVTVRAGPRLVLLGPP
jgi:diacylglycerol kinase family enzyme